MVRPLGETGHRACPPADWHRAGRTGPVAAVCFMAAKRPAGPCCCICRACRQNSRVFARRRAGPGAAGAHAAQPGLPSPLRRSIGSPSVELAACQIAAQQQPLRPVAGPLAHWPPKAVATGAGEMCWLWPDAAGAPRSAPLAAKPLAAGWTILELMWCRCGCSRHCSWLPALRRFRLF